MVEAHGGDASAIVYCGTRKSTEAITEAIKDDGLSAVAYHAGLAPAERDAAQEAFMQSEVQVVVATNAFGMGVDKADIRLVLHHDLPGSVESYYQEAGRAGRDGAPAKALLLWGLGDLRLRRLFIEKGAPTPDDVKKVWERMRGRGGQVGQVLSGTARQLADRAEVDPNVVPVVLGLLEEAGHLRREDGEDGRIRARLLDDAPLSALRVDLEALARHRRLDEARLERMVTYAGRAMCRRRALLDYFGDPEGPAPGTLCGGCDACEEARVRADSGIEISELARERVRAALSIIDSVDGRFGRRKIAAALVGLALDGLERTSLPQHPSAGQLSAIGEANTSLVLDRCVAAGLLGIRHDPYPVLGLTSGGRAVLEGHAEVPDEVASVAEDGYRSPSAAAATAAAPRRRKKKAKAPEDQGPLSPEDAALFEALRTLRSKLAKEKGVPAYVILHDAHLKALAAAHPKTEAALLEMPGMGPTRLERYGEALLEVLRDHES